MTLIKLFLMSTAKPFFGGGALSIETICLLYSNMEIKIMSHNGCELILESGNILNVKKRRLHRESRT